MRACLNCCGSVMLAIASGNEFQPLLFGENKKIFNSSCSRVVS